MSEALGFAPAPEKDNAPDLYGGRVFNDEKEELNFLQRLQGLGKLEGVEWNRELHHPRMQELMEKSKTEQTAGPTQAEMERYNELTRLRNQNNDPWPDDLREEFVRLQKLMDKRVESLRDRRN